MFHLNNYGAYFAKSTKKKILSIFEYNFEFLSVLIMILLINNSLKHQLVGGCTEQVYIVLETRNSSNVNHQLEPICPNKFIVISVYSRRSKMIH